MADSKLSSPFPDVDLQFVDATGRINRIWAEFLLRQFNRTGGTQGGDLSGIQRQVNQILQQISAIDGELGELDVRVESNPIAAVMVAVLARLARLEIQVASLPVAPTIQRAAAVLPEPVAPAARAQQSIPDPVAVASRPANDDLRKLIEAQT